MPAWLRLIDGRWLLGAILLGWLGVVFSGDSEPQWSRVGVLHESPAYVDLYVFPAARAARAAGADPYQTSAFDPRNRPYNYPSVWLTFMRFGADPGGIGRVAAAMALGAVASLLLFVGRLSLAQGLIFGLCAASPAVALGFERGNTDLVIFALLALAAASWRRWEGGGFPTIVVAAAAILKLYPVMAFGAWIGRDRKRLQAALVGLAAFATWMAEKHAEIARLLQNTGSGWVLSYGSRTFVKMLVQVQARARGVDWDERRLAWIGLLVAVVVVGLSARMGLKTEAKTVRLDPAHRAGFRTGAAIYIASFVMGSSFDYRLVFLLLTLPALWSWAMAGQRSALVCVPCVCVLLCANFAFERWIGFGAKELASWIVLACLCARLAADVQESLRSGDPENVSSLAEPPARG